MNRETAERLIVLERERQIDEEGWDETRDDCYTKGELADAARCYFIGANNLRSPEGRPIFFRGAKTPKLWPWDEDWYKPKNSLRDLVRAGALFLAEGDRLKRARLRGEPVTETSIETELGWVLDALMTIEPPPCFVAREPRPMAGAR